MSTDPAETTNLANEAPHAQTVKELRAPLEASRKPAPPGKRLNADLRYRSPELSGVDMQRPAFRPARRGYGST